MINAEILLLSMIISMICVFPVINCECQNHVIIFSNGDFILNITYSTRVDNELPDNLYIRGRYKSSYLSYNISYSVTNLSGKYLEEILITGNNGFFNGSYYSYMISNDLFLIINTNYIAYLEQNHIIFNDLKIIVETNDYNELLRWNITLIKILLMMKKPVLTINTSVLNGEYFLTIVLSNGSLSIDDLRDNDVKILLGIPHEIDPGIIFSMGTRIVKCYQTIENDTVIINRTYIVNGIEIFKYNKYYVIPLIISNNSLIISSIEYVLLKEVKWEINGEYNVIDANILVSGQGLGVDVREKIESVISDLGDLLDRYGCFSVKAEGFYFVIKGEKKRVLELSNQIGIETIENIDIVFHERNITSSTELLLFILVCGGVVIIVLLILRYYLLSRIRFLKHS